MISQIDNKLEKLISRTEVVEKDLEEYFGVLPTDKNELLDMLRNLRKHIRIYGRRAEGVEKYIEQLKTQLD